MVCQQCLVKAKSMHQQFWRQCGDCAANLSEQDTAWLSSLHASKTKNYTLDEICK
jgi:hypothetical protein